MGMGYTLPASPTRIENGDKFEKWGRGTPSRPFQQGLRMETNLRNGDGIHPPLPLPDRAENGVKYGEWGRVKYKEK
nr:hypothetical protein Iba_chr01bCG14210 [Ipomoea batatas]